MKVFLLRKLRYIQSRQIEAPAWRGNMLVLEDKTKKRGMLKLTWIEIIRNDKLLTNSTKDET